MCNICTSALLSGGTLLATTPLSVIAANKVRTTAVKHPNFINLLVLAALAVISIALPEIQR